MTKQPIEVKSTAVHSALVVLEAMCFLKNCEKAKVKKNKIVHFRGGGERLGTKVQWVFFYWSVLIQLISIAAKNLIGL